MSDWQVNLECTEGGSRKFWRARTEGSTLYVNFGRIGTTGQTQVKDFPSEDAADKELQSLERSKRKKGYEDAAGGAPAAEPSKPVATVTPIAPAAPVAPPPSATIPASFDLALDDKGRKVELRMVRDGEHVRLVAVEKYASADEAAKALGRLAAAFESEGYKGVARPGDL